MQPMASPPAHRSTSLHPAGEADLLLCCCKAEIILMTSSGVIIILKKILFQLSGVHYATVCTAHDW